MLGTERRPLDARTRKTARPQAVTSRSRPTIAILTVRALAAGLLLLAGLTTPSTAQVRPRQVIGVVRDEFGNGVVAVTVALDSAEGLRRTTTDSLGRFFFAEVDSGPHLLRAVRIGFRPVERRLSVPHRGTFIELEMVRVAQLDTVAIHSRRTGVFGKVLSRSPYAGLRGATVTVAGAHANVVTDSGGGFNLPLVAPGAYLVNIHRRGYAARLVSVLVPDDGAVELSVVLDESHATDARRHSALFMAEFESRVRMRRQNAVIVPRRELMGRLDLSLGEALRFSPSFLLSGLVVNDSLTCLFVNGEPAPGRVVDDFPAAEVLTVEVYGLRGDDSNTLSSRWPRGAPCGHGDLTVSESSGKTGLQPAGVGSGRIRADRFTRAIVIWTQR